MNGTHGTVHATQGILEWTEHCRDFFDLPSDNFFVISAFEETRQRPRSLCQDSVARRLLIHLTLMIVQETDFAKEWNCVLMLVKK
jgi:hypothetical protein